jgi:hypothetical protein
MPLRDHFRPPLDNVRSWDELHGQWPAMIVLALARKLPPRYVAGPNVHVGAYFEVDVASYEGDDPLPVASGGNGEEGGVATATWAPPQPTLTITADLSEHDEYEVRVYDTRRHRRLVAAVEIVSPANKDRPEARRVFVAKCAALLQQGVSVAIVDLVTTRQFNLFADLLRLVGPSDLSLAPEEPPLYAASCRGGRGPDSGRLETWAHALAVGQPLPTLPLWLADNLAVPLELDASYEETCRVLRIP